jgi:ArsR family transcriptional regulator
MPSRTSTLQMIGEETLEQAATVIRCLGHPLRLRLLEAMETGGQTVSELQHHTGAPQSAVSQQLSVLRGHGVVEGRREGSFVRYRIIEPKVGAILNCIRACEIDR